MPQQLRYLGKRLGPDILQKRFERVKPKSGLCKGALLLVSPLTIVVLLTLSPRPCSPQPTIRDNCIQQGNDTSDLADVWAVRAASELELQLLGCPGGSEIYRIGMIQVAGMRVPSVCSFFLAGFRIPFREQSSPFVQVRCSGLRLSSFLAFGSRDPTCQGTGRSLGEGSSLPFQGEKLGSKLPTWASTSESRPILGKQFLTPRLRGVAKVETLLSCRSGVLQGFHRSWVTCWVSQLLRLPVHLPFWSMYMLALHKLLLSTWNLLGTSWNVFKITSWLCGGFGKIWSLVPDHEVLRYWQTNYPQQSRKC